MSWFSKLFKSSKQSNDNTVYFIGSEQEIASQIISYSERQLANSINQNNSNNDLNIAEIQSRYPIEQFNKYHIIILPEYPKGYEMELTIIPFILEIKNTLLFIDLSNVKYLSSRELGMLVKIQNKSTSNKIKFFLIVNNNEKIISLLKITSLEKSFQILNSREDILMEGEKLAPNY